jgi:biotin carboxyl carrier protein
MVNPDTGLFMRYKLAGAYDSNVALLLTTGSSRGESYARLAEVLRRTSMRGPDLATNLEFHYGLVHWFLSNGVDAKPTTRFVVPYLTLVGQLKEAMDALDLGYAFERAVARCMPASKDPAAAKAAKECAVLKRTLMDRPLARLAEEPHMLSAWLSVHRKDFRVVEGRVVFQRNPVAILEETYHLLHMDAERNSPAAHRIWGSDQEVLDEAGDFYESLHEHTGEVSWPELDAALRGSEPAFGFDAATWQQVRAAHVGFQMGLELLGLLVLVADAVGFYDLVVNDDLTITIPERLFDADLQKRMKKVLVPPPATKADEVVAVSGGMYYGQEGPGMPTFVHEGMHFDVGQPLYIIEVMKMFNKVPATFAGTIDKILIEGDGQIVSKGQPLFKITPDERVVDVDEEAVAAAPRAKTDELMACIG